MTSTPSSDKVFGGSIARIYEEHLVPLLFEPYAADLVNRLGRRNSSRLLEIAAGTGVVTRAMAARLPAGVAITATDLNQAMLDQAAAVGTARPVEWRQADAMNLPFPDGAFDTVVCQFGVMFFPDRVAAFAEARRVLKPAGLFLFNVWDKLEYNEFAAIVTAALTPVFPADPPRFLPRTPYGYFDRDLIERDLAAAGFKPRSRINTVAARSRAASAQIPATAFCQGTPLRHEIESRDASRLADATDAAAQAIAHRFGRGAVDGKMQAHVILAQA